MERILTDRQEKILKTVIEEFIKDPTPIGSKWFLNNSIITASSATIRSEMSKLEYYGLLEKTHTSSGRVPSTKGYKYYEQHLSGNNLSTTLREQLEEIFHNRSLALEDVFSEAAKVIQEATKLVTLVRDVESIVKLSKIDLVELNREQSMIIIVSSNGKVSHKTITFPEGVSVKDVKICIRIINDRLIGVEMSNMTDRFKLIEPIIKKEIKSYERVMRMFLTSIFDHQINQNVNLNDSFTPSTSNDNLKTLLEIVKDNSIWEQLDRMNSNNEQIKIIHTEDIGNIDEKDYTIASTELTIPGTNKQFSIIGPKRMDYSTVKGILEFLKIEFNKKFNK